jgi:hypothetical protein
MNPPNSRPQCFFGTLEQCVEQYGGKSLFTLSDPVTFFSGARLETHRRAQSHDGSVLIVERQLGPTTCEIYVRPPAVRPQGIRTLAVPQANCA